MKDLEESNEQLEDDFLEALIEIEKVKEKKVRTKGKLVGLMIFVHSFSNMCLILTLILLMRSLKVREAKLLGKF